MAMCAVTATSLSPARHSRLSPLRRLPRPTAARLWALDPAELVSLVRVPVPAEPTARRVEALLLAGLSPRRVCRALGWESARLAALLDAELTAVSAADALRVCALVESCDRDRLAGAVQAA